MKKSILIITEKENFMIKAVASTLEKNGFLVNFVKGTESDFETRLHMASIFMLYPEHVASLPVGVEKQIEDELKKEEDKTLILVGSTAEDLAALKADFPAEHVGREYLRPLAIKQVVSDMEALFPHAEAPVRPKHTILVVDDDSTYLRMLAGCLAPNYEVTPVTSGMQAITYMAKKRPDLVLMDYEMPITTGAQVFEMMKSEPATTDIPVIFLTGKNDKNSILDVMQQGPAGYLLKSMSMDHIMDKIEEYFKEVDAIGE